MSKPTHALHFSETQGHILAEALEFYTRWCMGQLVLPSVVEMRRLPAVHPHSRFPMERAGEMAVPIDDQYKLEELLEQLRALLFPEFRTRGSSYGVGWNQQPEQQHSQIAYELRKAILGERNQRLGISNVNSLPFLHYSDQPLPVVYPLPDEPA